MSLDRPPPSSKANTFENYALEVKNRSKVVLIVDTVDPHTKKSKKKKFKTFMTLPLFKFLEFYHPRTVEQIYLIFVCPTEKVLKNITNNQRTHHPTHNVTGTLSTENDDVRALHAIEEAIRANKAMLKIHERLLELSKNYWLTDLNIQACLALQGPDVVLVSSSPISNNNNNTFNSPVNSEAVETPKHNPLKDTQQTEVFDTPSVSSKNSNTSKKKNSKNSKKQSPTKSSSSSSIPSIKKSKSGLMSDDNQVPLNNGAVGSSLDGEESKEVTVDLDIV
jgi:hypothetical protein